MSRITIISNVLGYGPRVLYYDEIRQELTISATGAVCCKRFNYGDSDTEDLLLKDEQYVNISEAAADRIFDYIGKFIQAYEPIWATDVGQWELKVEYDDGREESIYGPMLGTEPIDGIDLSEMIREEVPIKGLYVFDGENDTGKGKRKDFGQA